MCLFFPWEGREKRLASLARLITKWFSVVSEHGRRAPHTAGDVLSPSAGLRYGRFLGSAGSYLDDCTASSFPRCCSLLGWYICRTTTVVVRLDGSRALLALQNLTFFRTPHPLHTTLLDRCQPSAKLLLRQLSRASLSAATVCCCW